MNVTLDFIERRERQILVHSFLYYQLNENIISDITFDLWCKELAEIKNNHTELFEQSAYAEGFASFDGSSGFDLPYNTPEIQNIGNRILRYSKKRNY